FELTVRATDGELIRNEPLPIVITGGALTAFTSPVAGPPDVISPDADVTVAWDESGSPAPDARTIQRQHAMPTEAGTCAGLAWAADGPARPVSEVDPGGTPGSGWSFTESAFAADGCYRWVVALTDAAGREGRWNSGTVIVDSTAPPPPDVVATGDGVWQGDVNEVVWVRQGSGTLRLAGTGTDASGGVASTRFGPLDVPGGWAHDPGAVLGDPSAVDIGWDASASDTTLGVMSTDVQGLEGAARTVSLRVDGTPPGKPSWSSPPSGTSYEYESIELLWGGAPDVGSGLASEQLVQRQRGPVVTKGSCAGVSYQDDGPQRLVGRHQEETGLSSNKCYRWKLTARDRVGNVGGITTSGAVLFDGIAPVGAFEFPPSGTHASRTKTSLLIRWTQGDTGGSGGLLRAVERERTKRIAPDDCDGLRWKLDGPTITDPSPIRSSGLKSGYCYRWRLVLTDRAASVTTVISGTIAVMPPAALSVRRAL
ncbi:MAG: hypothetical protein H0V04_01165, partial [Chloroflexi bacterium]|nr:hypothetical protein [Chloroflexota bacterium]